MTFLLWIILYLWEPKMCRFAWQLLGMLGNVLGHPQHALQRPRHAYNVLGVLGMLFCKVLGVPHRKNPPHLLPYKLWSQGSSVPPSFHIWKLGLSSTERTGEKEEANEDEELIWKENGGTRDASFPVCFATWQLLIFLEN